MDSFESLVATLLGREGFWVRSSFKVELTKAEKVENWPSFFAAPGTRRDRVPCAEESATRRRVQVLCGFRWRCLCAAVSGWI